MLVDQELLGAGSRISMCTLTAQAGTCGFNRVSVLVPHSAISFHHTVMPSCALSRKERSSLRDSNGGSSANVALRGRLLRSRHAERSALLAATVLSQKRCGLPGRGCG